MEVVDVRRVGVSTGNPVVSLSGEIDMATADAVALALEPWLRAGGPVVVDVSEVTFMDSRGLHVVATAAKVLGDRGCIILHGARGPVWLVLQLSGLERIENVHFIGCSVLEPVG
jgi:anti-sigma B factor antagonist